MISKTPVAFPGASIKNLCIPEKVMHFCGFLSSFLSILIPWPFHSLPLPSPERFYRRSSCFIRFRQSDRDGRRRRRDRVRSHGRGRLPAIPHLRLGHVSGRNGHTGSCFARTTPYRIGCKKGGKLSELLCGRIKDFCKNYRTRRYPSALDRRSVYDQQGNIRIHCGYACITNNHPGADMSFQTTLRLAAKRARRRALCISLLVSICFTAIYSSSFTPS